MLLVRANFLAPALSQERRKVTLGFAGRRRRLDLNDFAAAADRVVTARWLGFLSFVYPTH
jgi:hypothetical protein